MLRNSLYAALFGAPPHPRRVVSHKENDPHLTRHDRAPHRGAAGLPPERLLHGPERRLGPELLVEQRRGAHAGLRLGDP